MSGAAEDLAAAEALLAAATAAGADAADVMAVSDTALEIGVAEGRLEEAGRAEAADLGLRVLVGRRQACVSGSDRRPESLGEMASRAVAMAREAPEDPYAGLAAVGMLAPPDPDAAAALDLLDQAPAPEPDALERLALEAEAGALAVEGVRQVEQAGATWRRDRVTLVASNGLSHQQERSLWTVSASAIAGEGLGRERDWAVELRRHRADLPEAAEIGARAGARAIAALGARKPRSGRFPVLYDERVSGGLIGHLLSAINGASVARGSSWASELMDEPVLPAALDLWEDPRIPRGRASRTIDAEGIRAERRTLVERGVLRSFVLDLATARQLGRETTGNARRPVSGPPRPGLSNIRLTAGTSGRAELIAEMGTGLLVTSLIGASINPTTGAYSRGASGFWVEGGEIVHPVNEITIAGSLPDMLRSIRAADDADPHKAVSVPSLLVEGLTVGA